MVEIKRFKNQDYKLFQNQHSASNLFVDPEFPAVSESLSHSGQSPVKGLSLEDIEWKRPKEVFASPQFVMDGYKRGDLHQGSVGNCWFIAACAAVTLNPDLLARVIPQDQSFDDDDYTGMFHFRFWLYGDWYDVVVDDQLPFYQGNLIYCSNGKDPHEMWPALLEKAYAKVCGSYEAMDSGHTTDALIDMTAGVEEAFQIFQLEEEGERPPNFKERILGLLHQGYAKKSMLGCHIIPDPKKKEAPVNNGLIKGHAYSITAVEDVTTMDDNTITLICMRNPWGNAAEWNEDWSDESELWNTVSDEEKKRIKYRRKKDGEFWMSFDDFYSNFHSLNICHRGPSSLETTEEETDCIKWSDISRENRVTWKEEAFHGEWIPGQTAGGWFDESNLKKFFTNPQYLIKLTSTDDVIVDFDETDQAQYCTAIISLMQKHTRARTVKGEQVPDGVGFLVCKVNDNINVFEHIEDGKLKFYMNQLKLMDDCCAASRSRSVTQRCRLPPGTYVIIPCTELPDQNAEFLLRIFTEKEVDQTFKGELDRDKEDLSDEDMAFTKEDFVDLLDGMKKLLDDLDEPSSRDNKKKQKDVEKQELCSIQ